MPDGLLFPALEGVAVGCVIGVIAVAIFMIAGRRRRWFDERTRAIKGEAARYTLALGLVLLLAAWLWSLVRPTEASLSIVVVAVVEVAAFAGLSAFVSRRM